MQSTDYIHTEVDTKIDPSNAPHKTLNDVLENIEIGWFHYRLLILCGLSFMADAMVCCISRWIIVICCIMLTIHACRRYLY